MNIQNVIMAVSAFSCGFLVAGGVIALIVGLGIVTRLVGITHTAKENRWYESMIFTGAILGNMLTVYRIPLSLGRPGLLILGVSAGIYTGGWIMALAEMVHMFPIFSRRIGITTGISMIIWNLALGKILGSLLQFYMNW
ncbi:stage V sporulation protein AB [Jingyaoa shaoxingensis]|nr:stage V sporulation protein AB [Jingyaoa shaoxingensis]